MRRCLVSAILSLALLYPRTAHAQPAEPTLKQFRDSLHTFEEGDQAGIVYVAPDGILIADPLSAAAGHWLAQELASRFPGRPVRLVVHLSELFERMVGGIAFPKSPTVGHIDFKNRASDTARAVGNAKTLPPMLAVLDADRDQQLDHSEWSRAAPELASADTNKDGAIGVHEAARLTRVVNNTFRTGTTLALGARRVQVVNPGGSFATAALFFQDERVLYTGTHPAFNTTGFAHHDVNPHHMLTWFREVAALRFDTVVNGRGESFPRDRFDAIAQYAQTLASAATTAYIAGRSLSEVSADSIMQKYAGDPIDARRRDNFDVWFRALGVSRLEIQGAGVAQYMMPNAEFCAGYQNCVTGGVLAGGIGGIRFVKSRLGLVVEGGSGQQFVASREGEFDNEAFAQRISRASMLFRFGTTRPTGRSIELLAGPTIVSAQASGVTVIKLATAPFGGRHTLEERQTVPALTAGINLVLPVSHSWSFYLPVRVTGSLKRHERMPDRLDVQAGIGLSRRLSQTVR